MKNDSEQSRNAVEYTLAGAAKAVGIGKTTIHTAIKRGRLSARRLEDGSYRIDASELARVYPPVPAERSEPSPWDDREQNRTAPEGVGTGTGTGIGEELAVLRLEVKMLRERLEDRDRERETARETVEDLRRRLDAEQEERRNLQRLLAAPERAQERPSGVMQGVEPPKASKGFLGRLLGR